MRRFALCLLTLAMGPLSRAEGVKDGEPSAKVVEGNNRFALDLYGRLRDRPGNLFMSPYSLSTALAMTYAGARGETAEQMAATLHLSLPPGTLHAAFAALERQIKGGDRRPYKLSVANALWGQEGEDFLPDFLKLLAENYEAGLRQVDFRSVEQACRTINNWVEEQTGGKIKDLLQPPHLSPNTSLVLTNAIYFKGDWASPFPKGATKDEMFAVTEDKRVPVPMMHRTGRLNYRDGGDFHVLDLPYAGNDLSMVILLPKKVDGLARFEESLTSEKLSAWLAKLGPHRVDVALPKFKVEAGFELQKALPAMGMTLAFTRSADFSGIDGKRDLFISAVIHKAFVDVNEEGTEAAAATAVVIARPAAVVRPEPVVEFRADHPFAFLIRHNRSGSILFLGRVTNPRG
jgi:serine protease inhibitor